MLRLKGEPDDSAADDDSIGETPPRPGEGFPDHPAMIHEPLGSDDFSDEEEDDDGRGPLWDTIPLGGVGIAAAAFVPTFLAIILGVPYLIGPGGPARAPVGPAQTAAPITADGDSTGRFSSSLSDMRRWDTGDHTEGSTAEAPAPSSPSPPTAAASRSPEPSPPPEPPQVQSEPIGPPAASATAPVTGGPSTDAGPQAPAPELPARIPEPQRRAAATGPVLEPHSVPGPRPASAAPDVPRPRLESRRVSGDWTPAAAFTDRAAAARLASSIERQGYPVEIRQDPSSTRPWVVWIGSQPSGAGRRR